MKRYNPAEIEAHWQATWERDGTYTVDFNDTTKPKYFGMSMLPGITGAGIHIGHGRTFQFSDIKVRTKRQQGFNAYNPIGWDSFGLPVENYAIKVGKKPREAHDEAKENFIRQLKRLGYSYDWTKEISTADPSYYRWTQWIFNQLYEQGLAYQKESPQWWCETDNTVLANEQVEAGRCWRCHNPVVKRNLKQWFFKITEYADEMLEATDDLDWTPMVKTMQKNWIGKSIGAEIDFAIVDHVEKLKVFTTRPDTLYGATFMVVAPEHPLLDSIVTPDQQSAVEEYKAQAQTKSEIDRMDQKREKTGVATGSYALHPLTNEEIPIWVADYVLMGYGTGAIMAVPAHDERDGAIAKQFELPIVEVISKPDGYEGESYHGDGVLVNSGPYDGFDSSAAREQIVEHLLRENIGTEKVNYKIRDWLISRQRYWGAPIPIIHCEKDGAVAVPDDQLPVILPEVENFKPTGGDTSVLASVTDWVNTTCPKCGGPAKRETDTMDGYACSSWYFLRYIDPLNESQAWDPAIEAHWGPVDFYNGADHAVAHLLYARFWMRFFYKMGLVSTPEPFRRMMYNAYIMAPDGRKMSKSLGNVIDPLEIMDSGYGADSLRVYEMFIAPYDMEAPWDPRGVPGTYRFLSRVWALVSEYNENDTVDIDSATESEILKIAHKTAKKVTEDIEKDKFNTAVSSMMEAVNGYFKLKTKGVGKHPAWTYAVESLLQVLAPFAPHITEELWSEMGHSDTIHVDHWPEWDESRLVEDVITIAIQVNGKLRGEISVQSDATKEDVESQALAHEKVVDILGAKKPTKVIYVPGRLVSIVV